MMTHQQVVVKSSACLSALFAQLSFFLSQIEVHTVHPSLLFYLLLTLSGLLDNNNNKKLLFELVTIA